MKLSFSAVIFLFLIISGCTKEKSGFNGSMEQLDAQGNPKGWKLFLNNENSKYYDVSLDSLNSKQGKYSLSIVNKAETNDEFSYASYLISGGFEGKEIELRGYIKTENISRGFAGLWLRIDRLDEVLAFDNMNKRAIKGTSDWKEYSIKLPYNPKATRIVLGGLLMGNGKMWFDNLRLYFDGKPIDELTSLKLLPADADTAFLSRSGVDTIKLNSRTLKNLTVLGHVWGFLKYYHPSVARGDFNMDVALFRIMPSVIEATDDVELSKTMEHWVDSFGLPKLCADCKLESGPDVYIKPDYSFLFDIKELDETLIKKLKYILANRNIGPNYYIEMSELGNPVLNNERGYGSMPYPDAGYRLLCLYRYWNMIQYFFPNKHLIGNDWNEVLPKFVPLFVNSANKTQYALTSLALISSIHDTHANIWSYNPALEAYRGKNALPFQAKFIRNKLTVTGYYADTLDVKQKMKVGDVISSIDGVSVKKLINKYLPITAASNYATQLRDLPRNYLLRTNKKSIVFEVVKGRTVQNVIMNTMERNKLNYSIDYNPNPNAPGYQIIYGNIGYLFPGKFKNRDLLLIKKSFAGTKGLIVDMRCYPSEFMVNTFVPYVKSGISEFVKCTIGSVREPGLFKVQTPAFINNNSLIGTNGYKNKVVVIVNEQTQSQAEYTTMAFQSSPSVTVIGSTTAGADGDVSTIVLPGGIYTWISGIGILYPDGTETQRKGVRIDYKIIPTIKGIKTGKDELLEKAKEIINED